MNRAGIVFVREDDLLDGAGDFFLLAEAAVVSFFLVGISQRVIFEKDNREGSKKKKEFR